jgi:hypothetical protein
LDVFFAWLGYAGVIATIVFFAHVAKRSFSKIFLQKMGKAFVPVFKKITRPAK